MTDSAGPALPISSGLTAFLDAQLAAVQSNILGSEDRNLAQNIDALYATQIGAKGLEARLPEGDLASASLFRRDWGPRCLQPTSRRTSSPGPPRTAACPTRRRRAQATGWI